MKFSQIKQNQQGIAHLGLLIFGLLVLTAISFAVFRVIDSKNNDQIGSSQDVDIAEPNIDEDAVSDSSFDDISASEQAND